MRKPLLGVVAALFLVQSAFAAEEYYISGNFNGCTNGRFYELMGGGLLECTEHIYFYAHAPKVIANSGEVIAIGGQRVSGRIRNGQVIKTSIVGKFTGCEFGKRYRLQNGLVFQCSESFVESSVNPDVTILIVEGNSAKITIDGSKRSGQLYR